MKLWAVVEDSCIYMDRECGNGYELGILIAVYETEEQAQSHISDGFNPKEYKASSQNKNSKNSKNKKRFYDKNENRFTRRVVEIETGVKVDLLEKGNKRV